MSDREVTKTILEIDLASYADVARVLEENLNVTAVKAFEDQIQSFVDHGLKSVDLDRADVVLGTAGDNAVLMFDRPDLMHEFARAVQVATATHNESKTLDAAKRWFRMGAATGLVLILESERRIVGLTITRAVRLEAAAATGELLVDQATYNGLAEHQRTGYGAEELVPGKRAETFTARRCKMIPGQILSSGGEKRDFFNSPGEARDPEISVAMLPSVSPLMIGREKELQQLDEAWPNKDIRLVSIVAFTGVGKTSLAINWWHRNRAAGAARILGWSFHSQDAAEAEDRQASAEPFLENALREWFGVTDPPKDSWARGEQLAQLIRRERMLLILDGLEPIQFGLGPQLGRLKDRGMIALLKELAAYNPGLCVCTSRLPLTDLEDYDNVGVFSIDLDNLTRESGAEYLKQLQVQGTDEERQSASEGFGNHALALTLLGSYLVIMCKGDIRQRDTMPNLFADPEKGGHARRMLRQYEKLFEGKPELEVLLTMGLFDRRADAGALRVVRRMPPGEWARALANLKKLRSIEYSDFNGPLDCHPLVREHFAEEYRKSNPDAFRATHAQLYDYYSKQAPPQPISLHEMTPLFYAIRHACQAGRHQEAYSDLYRKRVLRGDTDFLEMNVTGFGVNLSLVANFFEASVLEAAWRTPSPALSVADQAWVARRAGFALHSVGRLTEAVVPMQAAVASQLAQEDWIEAARSLVYLSEIYQGLGTLRDAIGVAAKSVKVSDRSGDDFQRLLGRMTLADALHQSGNIAAAVPLFEEAEAIQADLQGKDPGRHSSRGFRHSDLLLAVRGGSPARHHATANAEGRRATREASPEDTRTALAGPQSRS
jgi:class 3 adenylate cyclase/tetratricopeptide (TPR) repeat protein